MTEQELIYIRAIARTGSITQAARELFVSQPSLSECLARVETELGGPLFLRSSGGVTPTSLGLRYLDTAQQILDCIRDMHSQLEEYRSLSRGSLTFGIPTNLGASLLPAVLPAFHQLYPGIQLQFQEANSTELIRLLQSGSLDFAVIHEEKKHERICFEFLSDGQLLTKKDLAFLGQEPFLMIASRQKLRLVIDSILQAIEVTPQTRYTTKSMETAKRLAIAGMGVTILPRSYLNLFSSTEHLACFPLDAALNAYWRLVVGYPSQYPLSRCARAFLDKLKAITREADHTGAGSSLPQTHKPLPPV